MYNLYNDVKKNKNTKKIIIIENMESFMECMSRLHECKVCISVENLFITFVVVTSCHK